MSVLLGRRAVRPLTVVKSDRLNLFYRTQKNGPKVNHMQFKPGRLKIQQNDKSWYDAYANKEGKTNFSVYLTQGLCVAAVLREIFIDIISRKYMVKYYEHKETQLTAKSRLDPEYFEEKWSTGSQKIADLAESVRQDMKLKDDDVQSVHLFVHDTLSNESKVYGCINGVNGGAYGLPAYILNQSTDDVNVSEMRHKTFYKPEILVSSVRLDLSGLDKKEAFTKEIIDTLVLSDNAKQFLVARELHELANRFYFLFKMSFSTCCVVVQYILTASINEALGLFKQKLPVRLGMYSMVMAMTLSLWSAGKAFMRSDVDEYCDLKACALGPKFALGGVEFYDKASRRAMLLREHLPGAKAYFDENGDPRYVLSGIVANSSVSKRKENCQKALESLAQGEQVTSSRPIAQKIFDFCSDLE